MLENVGNAIIRLSKDRFGRNLGGGIPSCFRRVNQDVVVMATVVASQRRVKHFRSYGRLEAGSVNQLC